MNNQKLLQEEVKSFGFCRVCCKAIQPNEKVAEVYDGQPDYVHATECFDKYKEAFQGNEAIKKGYIIGRCGYCYAPVRILEEFSVSRFAPSQISDIDNYFNTTVPTLDNVGFFHIACIERVDKWEKEHPGFGQCVKEEEGIITVYISGACEANKEFIQQCLVRDGLQDAKIEYVEKLP